MCGVQYLLLVQHVELISGAHAKIGVPVVVVRTVVGGAVVYGALVQGPVVGGAVEGRSVVDGSVEGGTVVGGAFGSGTVVGGSVEGVGVGAMMVMMIGGGDGTPCIWTGEKEEGREEGGVGEIGRKKKVS